MTTRRGGGRKLPRKGKKKGGSSKGSSQKEKKSSGKSSIPPHVLKLIERTKKRRTSPGGVKRSKGKGIGERVGRIQKHTDGFAFLLVEEPGQPDIFIPAPMTGTAMDGDTVRVAVRAKSDGRMDGRVLEVIKRKRERLVGTLHEGVGHSYILPAGGGSPVQVYASGLKGAESGDRVVVQIVRWPDRRVGAVGEVVEVLGRAGDPEAELLVARRAHDLHEDFPDAVLAQVKTLPDHPRESDFENRTDLRDLNCFTIDPKDAKDFDDAVSIRRLKSDVWEVGIHIADVSHYITEGSPIDQEAYARGTSVYLVDRVIPMLPEGLSNGLCSLKPDCDRLTVSVFVQLDDEGEVIRHRVERSVIRSKRRFTYEEIDALFEGAHSKDDPKILTDLKAMVDLAKKRSAIRERRGSLDFDLQELKVHLDENGEVAEVVALERTWSHRLIEEFMILANEVVAERFTKAKLPTLYRVHAPPDPEKIAFFDEFLHPFGLSIKTGEAFNAFELQRIIKKIEGKPHENLVATVMLRSLQKAVYDTKNIRHFGLASEDYLHFTSPIRRYPDLIVHRLITSWEEGWRPSKDWKTRIHKRLTEQAEHLSEREREAQAAERESIKLKLMDHMSREVGNEFEGVVCGIQPWGFFVQLGVGLEGLVKIESLKERYRYDEKRLALLGPRREDVITLGTPVHVKLAQLNPELRQVDFEFLGIKSPGGE